MKNYQLSFDFFEKNPTVFETRIDGEYYHLLTTLIALGVDLETHGKRFDEACIAWDSLPQKAKSFAIIKVIFTIQTNYAPYIKRYLSKKSVFDFFNARSLFYNSVLFSDKRAFPFVVECMSEKMKEASPEDAEKLKKALNKSEKLEPGLLEVAFLRGVDLKTIQSLIALGAQWEKVNIVRCFHLAARFNSFDCLKYILENTSIPIDAQYEEGETVLMTLLRNKALDSALVSYLLEKGVNLSIANKNGDTAVHIAAKYASVENLQLILAAKPDLSLENKRGATPLESAALASHPKVENINILMNASKPDLNRKVDGETLFHRMKLSNDTIPTIEALLKCDMQGLVFQQKNAEGVSVADYFKNEISKDKSYHFTSVALNQLKMAADFQTWLVVYLDYLNKSKKNQSAAKAGTVFSLKKNMIEALQKAESLEDFKKMYLRLDKALIVKKDTLLKKIYRILRHIFSTKTNLFGKEGKIFERNTATFFRVIDKNLGLQNDKKGETPLPLTV